MDDYTQIMNEVGNVSDQGDIDSLDSLLGMLGPSSSDDGTDSPEEQGRDPLEEVGMNDSVSVNVPMANDEETKDLTKNLPPEILLKIFSLLSVSDLKMVMLVSRRWWKIGETPSLWSSLPVIVNTRNISVTPNILRTKRLRTLNKLKVEVSLTRKVTRGIVRHPGLKSLTVTNIKLTPKQSQAILTRVSRGSKLINLDISGNDLSRIDPGLLAKTVTKLVTLNVTVTQLTHEQIEAIFTALSENSRLVNFFIDRNNLSEVNPELLGKSVTNMETLSVVCTQLTHPQIEAIFTAVSQGRNWKNLFIRCNNLSGINTELLGSAVTKLVTLNVSLAKLSQEQVVTIFTHVSKGSRLSSLYIDGNNMSGVDAGLLAKAVTKLETLCASNTKLTHNQAVAILTAVSEGGRLINLDVSWNDLSGMDAEVWTKVVTRLDKLSVMKTRLTEEQTVAIMTAVSTGSRMTQLFIGGNRLTSVDPRLLVKVVEKLNTLSANCSQLTCKQIVYIMAALWQEGGKLKNLHLRCNNLSGIDKVLLAKAATNLVTFNITNTQLTQEQIVAILTAVSEGRKLSKLFLGGPDLKGIDPRLVAKAGSRVSSD